MGARPKAALNNQGRAASKQADQKVLSALSDRELVERCQRGQLEAYGELVNRYRNRVFALALSMVRNEEDATDLCQETFVKGWQAIRGFRKNASFYTWLYRIATNLCIDYARRRERRATVEFEETVDPDTDVDVEVPPSNQPLPTEEVRRRELRELIEAAIEKLSPEHRLVIQLREFEGLDYASLARVVGCSIGTVMSRLHYARKHLQKLLKKVL
ncbi:MAG: sigma-70 family RNA polymerase sigma factor [Verrucomicrobiae bacterium]|nr:sigma-70 family RNA polymerase sigma factor [Verrucomicrobiae bacterium]